MAGNRSDQLAVPRMAVSEMAASSLFDAPARLSPWRKVAVVVGYLALYLLLDWASMIHPFLGYNITPWSPPPGLSLALLFLFGLGYAPLLFIAGLFADLVFRGFSAPFHISVVANLVNAAGYAGLVWLLQRRLQFDARLESVRDMALLVAAALIGAANVAMLVVGVHVLLGALPEARFAEGTLRYWVGDAIGIAVTAPLLLRLRRFTRPVVGVPEMIGQVVALAGCLLFLAEVSVDEKFRFFYALFAPAVWIAVRHGLNGAAVVCFVSQFLLMADAIHDEMLATEIMELQGLMMTLAVTVLFTGVLVDERRAQEAARENLRNKVSHLARLSTGGEIASGLAHELNQPLTALLNYVRVGKAQIERGGEIAKVLEPLLKAEAQGVRAAETVQRLHDFLRYGELEISRFELIDAVNEAVALVRVAKRPGDVGVRVAPELAELVVRADRVQTMQIFTNLVTNAFEAIAEAGIADGVVEIACRVRGSDVDVAVADSGPGVPLEDRSRIFDSFFTTKAGGMGLGLSICRSLAEAQGGRIRYEHDDNGKHRFIFTLKLAEA